MEISSNFLPLNPGLYSVKERWNPSQVGFQIDSHLQESFPKVDYAEIAIFNVPEFEGTDNIPSENSEFEVLKGSQKTIKKNKPIILFEQQSSQIKNFTSKSIAILGCAIMGCDIWFIFII